MSESSKYFKLQISDFLNHHHEKFELFGLLLSIAMCLLCLALWICPTAFSADTIVSTRALLVFEFIVLHSATFMMLSKWVFVPMYFLFAYTFNMSSPDNAIMFTYLVIVLNRVRYIFMKNGEELEGINVAKSIYQFFLNYFPLILMFVLLGVIGFIPELGMSQAVLKNMEVKRVGDVAHPTMMAFGFFYYLRAIYLDKKISDRFKNRKRLQDVCQHIIVIGTNKVGKKIAARLSNYLGFCILICNNPEAIIDNHNRDEFLKMTPAKWAKKYKHLQLRRPEELLEKPKLIINTAPIEEANFILNNFEKGKLEQVVILDLSTIEFFSNHLETVDLPTPAPFNFFPQNAVVKLKTNMSTIGLFNPPMSQRTKFVHLEGEQQYAVDNVKRLFKGLGWKEKQIKQIKINNRL